MKLPKWNVHKVYDGDITAAPDKALLYMLPDEDCSKGAGASYKQIGVHLNSNENGGTDMALYIDERCKYLGNLQKDVKVKVQVEKTFFGAVTDKVDYIQPEGGRKIRVRGFIV
jgi:hypothetical protein